MSSYIISIFCVLKRDFDCLFYFSFFLLSPAYKILFENELSKKKKTKVKREKKRVSKYNIKEQRERVCIM